MSVNLYFIKGVMFGFEFVDSPDYGKFLVLDLLIARIYIEFDTDEE